MSLDHEIENDRNKTIIRLEHKCADLEKELAEAVWLLSNSERSRRIGWNERRDTFLKKMKEHAK